MFSRLLFLMVLEISRETGSECRKELRYDLTVAGEPLQKGN